MKRYWTEIYGRRSKGVCEIAPSGPTLERKVSPSPLAGEVFDETGEPLYVQAAVKDRRRDRYDVSRALVRGSKVEGQRGWRVPAPELERAVAIAARSVLDDKAAKF